MCDVRLDAHRVEVEAKCALHKRKLMGAVVLVNGIADTHECFCGAVDDDGECINFWYFDLIYRPVSNAFVNTGAALEPS